MIKNISGHLPFDTRSITFVSGKKSAEKGAEDTRRDAIRLQVHTTILPQIK
jgi:hypothetical protein